MAHRRLPCHAGGEGKESCPSPDTCCDTGAAQQRRRRTRTAPCEEPDKLSSGGMEEFGVGALRRSACDTGVARLGARANAVECRHQGCVDGKLHTAPQRQAIGDDSRRRSSSDLRVPWISALHGDRARQVVRRPVKKKILRMLRPSSSKRLRQRRLSWYVVRKFHITR